MAYFYTYIDPTEIEAQFKQKVDDEDDDDKRKRQLTDIEMVKRASFGSHDGDNKALQTKM